MTLRLGRAVGFGAVIWLIGFVWGTVVFMTPALKDVPSIRLVSRYPLISVPLLIVFPLLAYWLAPKCVVRGGPGVPHVGAVFVAVNVLLDAAILVGIFQSGWEYFAFLSVWVCYALVIVAARTALTRAARLA